MPFWCIPKKEKETRKKKSLEEILLVLCESSIPMINAGVIDEVKSIAKYDMSLPIMKAHGLREILEYIEGKKQLNTVVEEATNQINQYAKRQDTWFRNKYNSQYDIVDVQKDISDNCSNILSLYHDMYK